jgi:hypothetical protein
MDFISDAESTRPDPATHCKKIETALLKKISQKAGNEFQQAAYLDALEEIANAECPYAPAIKTIYQGLKVVSMDLLF